jgi:NAD(P)-dependent dehydrogenase (short-subunit alcohol dehydrogenase family)
MSGALPAALDALLEVTVAPSFSRFGPEVRARLFDWEDPPPGALDGRHALVTGATSGIGRALAEGLAALGATVHAVGRDTAKLTPGDSIVPERADLSSLEEVRELADRIAGLDRLDLVAHVAGALVPPGRPTADGIDLTLQVHVVAPFLLTERLLPRLAATGGRVLTMTSGGMYTQRLDVQELVHPTGGGTTTYARAKRAQVELNRCWAERHADLGVGFHALHPGWVDTPGLRTSLPGFARRLAPVLRTPEQGADTACWLAWTPEATAPGGDLWLDRRRRHTTLPWTRTPEGEAERLWDLLGALSA